MRNLLAIVLDSPVHRNHILGIEGAKLRVVDLRHL